MTRKLEEDFHGNLPEKKQQKKKVTEKDVAAIYGNEEKPAETPAGLEGLSFDTTKADVVKVKIGEKTYSLVSDSFIEKTNKHMQVLYAKVLRLERDRIEDSRTINNLKSTNRQTESKLQQMSSKLGRGNVRSFESD